MKRLIISLMIFTYIFQTKIYAYENETNNELIEQQKQYKISEFINQSEKYTEDIDISEIYKNGLNGKFDNNRILSIIFSIMGDSLKNSLITISGIIIIIIINSILKAISENLGNDSVSQMAYYIQYVLIVTLLMKNFSDIISEIKSSILDLTAFSNTLIPLLTSLTIATGNITTSSLVEPILLAIVTFASNFINTVLIPLILVSTALGIISKISNQVRIERISNFLNKTSVWVLTTVLGVFIGIASLEGGLTSNVDNITKKAGKSVISVAVPVVGGILGDAIDTIVGYTNLIKNAAGLVGIVVVLSICLKPIINLTTIMTVYYLSAALCEPVAEKNVVELIEQMGKTFKTLLAVMIAITTMIIIGLAIVIKITS
ncbi:MAG: stage III sporulation protein AE [Clostridia bacterium]|nr:stage III sporulation protein AE [Clostridia bacterium]